MDILEERKADYFQYLSFHAFYASSIPDISAANWVKGRVIKDKILLAQEMMSHLEKKISSSKIAMKLTKPSLIML